MAITINGMIHNNDYYGYDIILETDNNTVVASHRKDQASGHFIFLIRRSRLLQYSSFFVTSFEEY